MIFKGVKLPGIFKTDLQDTQYLGFELSIDALKESMKMSGMDRSCESSDSSSSQPVNLKGRGFKGKEVIAMSRPHIACHHCSLEEMSGISSSQPRKILKNQTCVPTI